MSSSESVPVPDEAVADIQQGPVQEQEQVQREEEPDASQEQAPIVDQSPTQEQAQVQREAEPDMSQEQAPVVDQSPVQEQAQVQREAEPDMSQEQAASGEDLRLAVADTCTLGSLLSFIHGGKQCDECRGAIPEGEDHFTCKDCETLASEQQMGFDLCLPCKQRVDARLEQKIPMELGNGYHDYSTHVMTKTQWRNDPAAQQLHDALSRIPGTHPVTFRGHEALAFAKAQSQVLTHLSATGIEVPDLCQTISLELDTLPPSSAPTEVKVAVAIAKAVSMAATEVEEARRGQKRARGEES